MLLDKKKLLLINPVTKSSFWGNFHFPSLGLPLLAALTPDLYNVEIIDEAQKPISTFPYADVVAISVLTATANRAYVIGDHYMSLGIPVIMGGMHVSALPEEALHHCNTVIVGEGDDIWREVLQDIESGNLKRLYNVKQRPTLQQSPIPRWDLIRKGNVRGTEIIYSVQAGRGCPNACNFCNVPEMFGKNYRKRIINDVIKEIELLNVNRFLLIDDNLLADITYAKELLRNLAELKKEWFGLASLMHLENDEILRLLEAAGCKYLFIGFETTNDDNLNSVGKYVNRKKNYEEIVNKIQSHGIKIIGSFIVGLDYDDVSVFDSIYEFINKNKLYIPIVNILTPYPGTKIYKQFEQENRMISYDWNSYSCDEVVFIPNKMTVDELKNNHEILAREILKLAKSNFVKTKKTGYGVYDF